MAKIINITGISDIRTAPVAGEIAAGGGRGLIITSSYGRARRIASDLSFFAPCKVAVLPDEEQSILRFEARSAEIMAARLGVYRLLAGEDQGIVVAPVMGAFKPLPPAEVFLKDIVELKTGGDIERQSLISSLGKLGYERSSTAEAPGQFAVRGDIIDFYMPGDAEPVRVELFDTEIDSMRVFDHMTQRSLENISHKTIYPARIMLDDAEAFERAKKTISADPDISEEEKAFIFECMDEGINHQYLERFMTSFYPQPAHIWDMLHGSDFVIIEDPSRIAEEIKDRNVDGILETVNQLPDDKTVYYFTPFAQQIPFTERLDELSHIESRQAPAFNGRLDVLETELKRYVKNGYEVTLVCSSQDRLINLAELIDRIGLKGKVELKEGSISSGTELPDTKRVWISETDMFPNIRRRRSRRRKGAPIKAFTDLHKGDYVVHEAHGVGRFIGVEKMDIHGSVRDYLRIEYAGKDVLFVPVDQMESIQKYVGSEGVEPKINGLSGGDWQKTKARAKAAIKDMAEEFLKLSAERTVAQGYCFGADSAWQKEFEDSFPYAETEDQLRCSEEIKKDMESPKAMDRLLCGDVGYGKTEVACRAVFKCVEQGKQAAVLVPTTILANQHYHTFKERFADYPFAIEMLSRFRTDRQQDKIVRDIEKGDIDIVIGTHRLLSGDVKFKDLGLLVIDEEQRFGVMHKDAIKRLKSNVDVLTLTATPIPRTLHMSLTGIRDMSVIEEPPEDRYPVQTYVMEQDDALLAEAIRRELDRGGQVYVVYNRVRGIHMMARKIRDLVPEANIAVGHGQMGERELEDVMMDFVNGETNVLVATTIIESGLDIPNVNTLIVIDADKFGLSQLYQLRGRVGRSNRMAYAFLMYKKDKVLSEIAEKRLRAIREFTEFGSGFRVAMRDLELRGAGNILGVEQSGHMLQIGYELYCKLVDEAVRELKGEAPPVERADTSVELELPAYIPENYVNDEIVRLDIYKRIASAENADDRSELLDELVDRFGEPPAPAQNLIEIAITRNLASRCGISKVVAQKDRIVFVFTENSILGPEIFAGLMDAYGGKITIYGGKEPRISLYYGKDDPAEEAQKLLEKMLGIEESVNAQERDQ